MLKTLYKCKDKLTAIVKTTSHFVVFFCCLSLIILSSNANASVQQQLKFKHLSTEDGLSQSYVFDIAQDQQGFIWIATEDGLDRYDGENFVHYRHNSADINSIADNIITKIFIDNSNALWIGTVNGLSRYNRKLNNFDNFTHIKGEPTSLVDNDIYEIYQDLGNKEKKIPPKLWVATKKGIQTFNPSTNNFSLVRVRNFEDQLVQVISIFQDSNRKYWFGTFENGIYLANENLSNVVELNYPNTEENTPALSSKTKLYDIKNIANEYWLATNKGLFLVDKNYQLKYHYSTDNKDKPLLSNEVRTIEKDNNEQVWLGTKQGLNIINLMTGNISHYQNNSAPDSLSGNWVWHLYQDKNNNMWIGTFGKGLSMTNPTLNKFQHLLNNSEIASFAESTDGEIWYTPAPPMLGILSETGHKHSNNDISLIDTSIILSGEKNELWLLGRDNIFYQIESNTNQLTLHNWEKSNYDGLSPLHYKNKTIWFIDEKGNLTSYNIDKIFNKHTAPDASIITAFNFENDNTIWFTTSSNKVYKYSVGNNKFVQIESSKNIAFPIKETKNIAITEQLIWLSSYSNGVGILNRKTGDIEAINEGNHLKNNHISSLLIDQNDNAWVATNKNISVINANTKVVKNFGIDYGISNNEFIDNAALKTKNNTFYFGGSNGLVKFDPLDLLEIKQDIPSPVLTDLLIANKKITVKKEEKKRKASEDSTNEFTLTKQLNNLDKLTLKHQQSPFSIQFIAPNAKLPSQISYRYRLLNLEENWIESGENNHRATYTNLNSGDYTFELQAYDLHDIKQIETKRLAIHILPPWWLTQSAIIIYSLSLLLIITYIFQQFRHKRLYHLQIKLSEERLKLSLWGSGDEMWDWNIEQGKIYRSNIWGILEFPQDGRRNVGAEQTNIHQQDLPRVREALSEHFDKKTDHFEITYRVQDKEGKWVWVLDRGKIVGRNNNDVPTRMTGTLKDISQIKKADERLRLFAKCIENISDAVVIYDRQFNIVDVNKAFQRITHKSKQQMVGTSLRFTQYPESFTLNVKKHLLSRGSWHGEIESKRDNDDIYLTDLNIDIIRDEDLNISHFVGVFSDITKRKETEAELRKLANTDTLTELPNRSYFQANQSRLVNSKTPHALLVFDLDNFKKVNDSMGHEVGDLLLCKVAERILSIGRKKDTIYRLGGDEFSILIEDTNDIHTITTIAKDILRTIAQPLKLRNQELVLFSSIGIVLYPEDGKNPQELLKNADTAMYHAKDTGGNKYQFFSDSMNKKAVKRLQIESLIRHGLKEDFFSVFYQPKIEITSGKVAGMEALVRFETPSKGIISPVVFIPVSEETGQIIDIGEIVLRKSCFATKKWIDAGLFEGRVAVNLSAVQFTQPNLVAMISDILKESQLPPKHLELEITEGTVMDSPQQAIDTMLQIRAMGIHLSLDDFGTGYSSLAYLKKFPLNTLKIDKAFVDDIEISEQGRNMVATIVTIAHNLDLQVVAEGVETNHQLSFLSGLRCEQLQGYLYSKPLPENDFQKYLLSHQITNNSTTFGKS